PWRHGLYRRDEPRVHGRRRDRLRGRPDRPDLPDPESQRRRLLWLRHELFGLMKIATFNINGINARLPVVLHWLEVARPDIVGLQEIKCLDEAFPRAPFEALGYNVATHGQKSFNGVALLSKLPFDEVHRGLPGAPGDKQARLIEGVFSTDRGSLRVCNIYLPNGNPVDSEKFPYKLGWMDRLDQFIRSRLTQEE